MKYLLLILFVFIFISSFAKIKLYISKSTGQYTRASGSYTKEADRYTSGDFEWSLDGPIRLKILPDSQSLSIRPGETKTWKGIVIPDTSKAPAKGDSVFATINYWGTTVFSQPKSDSLPKGYKVKSTYTCNKCKKHEPSSGEHQIIERDVKGSFDYVIYTMNITFEGPDCAYKGSKLQQTAKGYPAGGSYEWKSLNPDVLEVIADGSKATITCKNDNGIGTAKIQVAYTVGEVTHIETREIVFFRLVPKLTHKFICDGISAEVTLVSQPRIVPKSRIKESIGNLRVVGEAVVGEGESPVNIAGKTTIDFSPVDDKLTCKADTVYWFIADKKRNECIDSCIYKIRATGINNATATKDTIWGEIENLKVSAQLGNCINGDARITLSTTLTRWPQYTSKDSANTRTFIPNGPYPILILTYNQVGAQSNGEPIYKMKARFEPGDFKMSATVARNPTKQTSQFYPLVKFEEEFHVKQFNGNTNIEELKHLLSASQVINAVNATIPKSDSYTRFGQQAAYNNYLKVCKAKLLQGVANEIKEFNDVTSKWATNIRCRLEQEAKDSLRAAFKETGIFIADMPCAYPQCLKTENKGGKK